MSIRSVNNPIRHAQREIGANLERAMALLDTPADDNTPLPWRDCRDILAEVRGALVVLDVEGALTLCDELLATVDAIAAGRVLSQARALDLLLYGMLLLPRYLERVRVQRRELPDALLPMLNALRAMRRTLPLPDYQFINFDIMDPGMDTLASGAAARRLAEDWPRRLRRARYRLQLGLLGLFRRRDITGNCRTVRDALDRLGPHLGDTVTARWLRLCSLVLEQAAQDHLPVDGSMRLMLARLDHHLGAILRQSNGGLDQPPPDLVQRALLYYTLLGSAHERDLHAVRDVLGLGRALSLPALLEHERRAMSAPDSKALEAVIAAMSEDMERLKSGIELLARQSVISGGERDALCTQLAALANTLVMIGLEDVASPLGEDLGQLQVDPRTLSQAELWALLHRVAENVSRAEDAVRGLVRGELRRREDTATVQAARDRALLECLAELGHIRSALEDFNDKNEDGVHITAMAEPVARIAGTLRMLDAFDAAELTARTGYWIGRLAPEHRHAEQISLVADSLIALESYLETLLERPDADTDTLWVGQDALRQLASLPDARPLPPKPMA